MSIVLLAILAVMWVAFLLPVIAPRRRGGRVRRRLGRAEAAGWLSSPELSPPGGRSGTAGTSRRRVGPGRTRAGSRAAGRPVMRRRRVLLGLTLAAAASIRVGYLLGGHWWIVEAVAGALLSAYVIALVVRGFRRSHAARSAPPRPPGRTAMATTPSSPTPREPSGRRGLRRRRRPDGPLWGAPLLESQGPQTPE